MASDRGEQGKATGMRRTTRFGVVIVAALSLLTGCTPTAKPITSVTSSPTVTLAPEIGNIKYSFNSGDATSTAPASIAIEVNGKWRQLNASDKTATVGACTVLFYSIGLPAKTKVTVANQREQSTIILNGFLAEAGLKATPTSVALATNETADGQRQLVEVVSAAPATEAGYNVRLYARAFTNQSAFIYVQRCPEHAILDAQSYLRINTA